MKKNFAIHNFVYVLAGVFLLPMMKDFAQESISAARPDDATWPAFIRDSASFGKPLILTARKRIAISPGAGEFKSVEEKVSWDPKKTAVIICDMWNKHWCKGASERVAEMAPRMNEVVSDLRARGVLIIHAPSETMNFYTSATQRLMAMAAPKAQSRTPVQKDGYPLGLVKEGSFPIDHSDAGCDCESKCKVGNPWRRQIETLEIMEGDAITDNDQAYNLMRQRDIDNVIIMGVHTNMCVLNRPFAIRAMVKKGQNVMLMRDMTDTMYCHTMRPQVSHFRGTDLVIEFIEKYWCPTITSADVTGKPAFHFKADQQ